MKRTVLRAGNDPIRPTILPTNRFRSFFAHLFIHPHPLSTANNSDPRLLSPVFNDHHPAIPSWLDQSSATFRCQTCLPNYGESWCIGVAHTRHFVACEFLIDIRASTANVVLARWEDFSLKNINWRYGDGFNVFLVRLRNSGFSSFLFLPWPIIPKKCGNCMS